MELPRGTGKNVVIVAGAFLACLGALLCVQLRDLPSGGGATIGRPDPSPSAAPEKPCYLYVTEGNALGMSPELQFIPAFASREALLAYADARLVGNAPVSVDSLKGLASLEKRGARADVVGFDLVSMQIVGSRGRSWIHPTWCWEQPPR